MATETETIETPTDPIDPVDPIIDPVQEPADEQNVGDWDDVPPPPEEDADAAEEKTDDNNDADAGDAEEAQAASEETPDFSKYNTNVAERLWRAKKAAEQSYVTSSPDLIKHAGEYQAWRQKMGFLNKYIEEYDTAMQVVAEKRNQLFKQYALLTEGTPLYDHIGKPLTEEQLSEMQESGDLKSPEGIQARTMSVMKVAEEIGPGSLMAHQQLAMMQDELNIIDYQSHTAKYIDEWETVVTSQLDTEVKAVRDLGKKRDHYIEKVDRLRGHVNKIEHRGKGIAPKKLTDHLARNEKKLVEADALYEETAHTVSVVLYEATERGWVDFYPVVKNVMKFEINRLGRESSCYGSYHATLTELKSDYREATKDTADAPATGSAL